MLHDTTKGPLALKGHKYPSKAHALKVKEHLLSRNEKIAAESTAVFISGEVVEDIKYCDQTKHFRQNRYFFYLSGCNIPGSSVLYDFAADKLTLFLPEIDYDDVMWSGMPMSLEQARAKYDADEVVYVSEAASRLAQLSGHKIFTTDLDTVPAELQAALSAGDKDLFWALDEARMIKDWYEAELMRHAAKITDNSHFAVMSALPIETNEGHMHAEFTYHAMRQGSKNQAYDPICCAGPTCSTLHWVKNDEDFDTKQSVLIDAGAEWENYAADVTRCFPITGKFTKEHREVYEAVLDMQTQCFAEIKPGKLWDDIHFVAHRVLIKHFLKLGIFHDSFSEEEIFASGASVAFFPHGLGHLLGMDTHDVGGEPNYEDPNPLLKFLRLRRPLQEGMVVTNEPGIYFNPFLIEEFIDKHPKRAEIVNREVMEKYLYVGGVRIEDDILITKDGYENFTGITSNPDEIERIVTDGIKKGRSHFHAVV